MKKICIALDYNPTAEKVAKVGFAYAKAMAAEIYLIHVISDPIYYDIEYDPIMGYESPFYDPNFELMQGLKKSAEEFLLTSAEYLGCENTNIKVLEGDAGEAILDYCLENSMDSLVVGTHSHSVMENIMMGNTALKIVRHTKIPLLVVPTKHTKDQLEK